MYVKQSQLKEFFVTLFGRTLFQAENVRISRMSIVMADIKYVAHVRNELEIQVFNTIEIPCPNI